MSAAASGSLLRMGTRREKAFAFYPVTWSLGACALRRDRLSSMLPPLWRRNGRDDCVGSAPPAVSHRSSLRLWRSRFDRDVRAIPVAENRGLLLAIGRDLAWATNRDFGRRILAGSPRSGKFYAPGVPSELGLRDLRRSFSGAPTVAGGSELRLSSDRSLLPRQKRSSTRSLLRRAYGSSPTCARRLI